MMQPSVQTRKRTLPRENVARNSDPHKGAIPFRRVGDYHDIVKDLAQHADGAFNNWSTVDPQESLVAAPHPAATTSGKNYRTRAHRIPAASDSVRTDLPTIGSACLTVKHGDFLSSVAFCRLRAA
jgi:hypothetical protein